MWSKPLLCRFQQLGKIPQTQVSQGFAVFRLAPSRIPPRHSQSKRATNCANPGFWAIEFCTRCGQTCGQADFLTISACGGGACIAGVSRDCGHCISRLEGGATRSQSRRATNCATPPIFNKTPLYYSILGRFRKAFLIMVKIVGWLQKRADFRKTETRRPLCRRDLCCKALLLYRLGGAVARIICGAWSAFLRPWRAHPSWPHAPLRSRRAAFWRSTKRFPPSRPP